MVPPTTPPTRSSGQGRQSILGRLSLSPSHKGQKSKTPDNTEAPPRVLQKHGARSAWTSDRNPVVGPSYESMYPQTPPKGTNALNGQSTEDFGDHQVTNGGVGKPWSPLRTSDSAYRMLRHRGAGRPSLIPVSSQSENRFAAERTTRVHPQPVNPSNSPPRSRNPIYPALASPPRTYPAAVFPSPPTRDTQASADRPSVLKIDTTSPGMHPRTSSSTRTITESSPGTGQSVRTKLTCSITDTESEASTHHRLFTISAGEGVIRYHDSLASTYRQTRTPDDEHSAIRCEQLENSHSTLQWAHGIGSSILFGLSTVDPSDPASCYRCSNGTRTRTHRGGRICQSNDFNFDTIRIGSDYDDFTQAILQARDTAKQTRPTTPSSSWANRRHYPSDPSRTQFKCPAKGRISFDSQRDGCPNGTESANNQLIPHKDVFEIASSCHSEPIKGPIEFAYAPTAGTPFGQYRSRCASECAVSAEPSPTTPA